MTYNLLDYLESSAAAHPGKAALEDPNISLTYAQLLSSAQAIGSALAELTGPGRPVAVCMDKGAQAVTAFMGAMYAGCYYCYLDPKQPAPRSRAILEGLCPGAVITAEAGTPALEGLSCPVLTYESAAAAPVDAPRLARIRSTRIDTDPAYCSFTSGSTGVPKGVLVSHRSVIDFIENFVELFHITGDDVLACQSPLDFDVSVKDIFSSLRVGATVLLVPKFYFVFLANLLEWLDSKGATTLIWAVSALCLLSERKALEFCRPGSINKILFSGEVMPPNHLMYWKELYPDAVFVNLYGPTEITCNCTYHILPQDWSGGEIPMGIPFPNERVFLLDENDCLVTQADTPGEVCVAGTAVTLGYCRNDEQTARAFTLNPLQKDWQERIYRTGDIAVYGAQGLLYYRGRRDRQIKRHGRRVELIEIENALHQLEGVQRACVLYFKDSGRLVAFYSGQEQNRKALARPLQAIIPDYMVPDEFVFRSSLPLNSHGKLDRATLEQEYLQAASS